MAIQGVKYIDMTGQQHTTALSDLDAAFLDPLGRILIHNVGTWEPIFYSIPSLNVATNNVVCAGICGFDASGPPFPLVRVIFFINCMVDLFGEHCNSKSIARVLLLHASYVCCPLTTTSMHHHDFNASSAVIQHHQNQHHFLLGETSSKLGNDTAPIGTHPPSRGASSHGHPMHARKVWDAHYTVKVDDHMMWCICSPRASSAAQLHQRQPRAAGEPQAVLRCLHGHRSGAGGHDAG